MGSWGLVPFAVSALLTALCALFVWRRRDKPGAGAFAGLLLMETVWSVAYTCELAAPSLAGKVLWDDVQLAAMVGSMLFILRFVWSYRGRAPRRAKLVQALYMLLPGLALLWVVSDPLHGLARGSAHIEQTPSFDVLLYDFTTLELLFFAQSYATLLYMVVMLSRIGAAQHRTHGLLLTLIVAGLLAPTAISTAGMLGFRPLGQRDMSPAAFGIAALVITWAMFRRRMFELVPVARHVVFEQLPDPVLVLDPQDRIVDLNPCAQRLLNGHARTVGSALSQLLPAADGLRTLEAGAVLEVEVGAHTFEARSESLAGTNAPSPGRVVLLREITARKSAERALQRAHEALELRVQERTRELHQANEAMTLEIAERNRAEEAARESERRRDALKEELHHSQKLDSIGRLAGGIAHDFNNLLTVILGQIELSMILQERGLDTRQCLEQAMQAGHSAADLTRQLLAFARKQPNAPRVLSPNQTVEETHRMLLRLIGEDVRLQLSLTPELKRVRMDQGHLEQILLNLTVNARDAMPSGGVLRIATSNVALESATLLAKGLPSAPNDYVQLRVADTGMGMSEQVLAQIFEPFFTTKPVGKGTGIGLSTVYGLVKQAGGFVDVESHPGVGTTFDLYLPATEADQDEAPKPASSKIPLGVERVALVEDQTALRELMSTQLARLGYQVEPFARAEDALLALSPERSDVQILVTDVVLGGMSGPALASQLRKQHSALKILYVSGYTNGEILARGLDEEAVRLLYKPFTMRELAQAVRAALDGAS